MSESGNRWEPDESAAEPGPGAPQPAEGETTPRKRGLLSRTTVLLVAAGLALFIAGGVGGYALATARTSSTQLVPTGFRLEGGFGGFGDGDGRRQSNAFGQSNPFGSAPQGTTT